MTNRRVVLIMATAAVLFYGSYRVGKHVGIVQTDTPVILSVPAPQPPYAPVFELTKDYDLYVNTYGWSFSCMSIEVGKNGSKGTVSPNLESKKCREGMKR